MRRTVSVAERRGWDRLPISIPFFVRGTSASGEEFLEFATALNLSAGGLLLATRRYLDPGTQSPWRFPLLWSTKRNCRARCLSCTPRYCAVRPIGNIFFWDCNSKSPC